MAKFYPTIVNSFHGSQGERLVYEALSQLSDAYTIFHSFRWIGELDQYRSEGEADFLILHPEKGILSIEVKAGGISYRDGNWVQRNRNTGQEKVIDPFGQAAESQFRIQRYLQKKYFQKIPMIGRAAWFPSVEIKKGLNLPLEVSYDIVLDINALENTEAYLDKAFTFWQENLRRPAVSLNRNEVDSLIGLLMPSFDIAETIASNAEEEQVSYVRLTRQQAAILHYLEEQREAAIHGLAGTGKSLLAV